MKVDPNFVYDMFAFLHKPLRELDKKEGGNFLERFLIGPQTIFEQSQLKIEEIKTLNNPALIREDLLKYLKDHVGLTSELNNITKDLTTNELRKLIMLAVALWKQKGLEVGYRNIVRLFTGKGSRTFNWFDFRWIAGEKALGSEMLGDDAWLISLPGVTATTPTGNVVLLLNLDGNVLDGSSLRNHARDHTRLDYGIGGAVAGATKHADFDGGLSVLAGTLNTLPGDIISVTPTTAYVFSGAFTVELFFRTKVAQNAVLFNWAGAGKQVEIRLNTNTNELSFTLSDNTNTFTGTISSAGNLDDGDWRHAALVVDRTEKKARLYLNGVESTAAIDVTALGNPGPVGADIFIGGTSPGVELFAGQMDNVRVSLSAQYPVTNATLPVPAADFIPFQEEQLDEFKTDIRVVDDGTLNHALIRRILNIMRPASERLNVIFVDFFEDFTAGKGDLLTLSPGAVAIDGELELPTGAVEQCSTSGNEDFQDIVLQTRARVQAGAQLRIRFLITDALNYYRLTVDVDTQTAALEKVVAGVATALSSPMSVSVFADVFYIWTVVTDFNDMTGETVLKIYQDANLVFEVFDSEFEKGTWAIEASGGKVFFSDIEMFMTPLTIETVNPGFSL